MSTESRYSFEPIAHGQGGFATVTKGRDNELQRDVAVKVLDSLARDFTEEEQERFRREARILAKLSHTNIPSIYDVDFKSGNFQLFFQFIEGRTLRQIIDEEGEIDIADVRRWFHQIASALEHAHALGIIHRDVKPGNIIVTPDLEAAYLVDFGIALTADEAKKLTRSGYVIGTPGYMSPEQQAGDEVDHRTDIYSLAITLYEALAGKPIPKGQYLELSLANEGIPPQIDDLVYDSLEERTKRVESARSFSQRLAGALKAVRPLSEVLVHGKLHEKALALEELTAEEFMQLPGGQRELFLATVHDIVTSDEEQLVSATARFLELIVTRGLRLEVDDFREIAEPAILWGFERMFGAHIGRRSIRDALEHAARDARGTIHEVLAECFLHFIEAKDLTASPSWYLHAVRVVLQNLLANPACKAPRPLAGLLREINSLQRAST